MDEHTANAPGRDEDVFRQIRSDIRAGKLIGRGSLSQAEELLDGAEGRGAEWHFLKGAVCYRKGWMDEARRHYEEASRMEPENPEYRKTVERMREMKRYRPKGTPADTLSALPDLAVCGIICAGGFCGWFCCHQSTLYCTKSCMYTCAYTCTRCE